jgi:hypothetical protein
MKASHRKEDADFVARARAELQLGYSSFGIRLGRTARAMRDYETNRRPVPISIMLAIRYLIHQHQTALGRDKSET